MCLTNVDMEPLRNIMGYRDIFGVQNGHQHKTGNENFKREVVFKKRIFIL